MHVIQYLANVAVFFCAGALTISPLVLLVATVPLLMPSASGAVMKALGIAILAIYVGAALLLLRWARFAAEHRMRGDRYVESASAASADLRLLLSSMPIVGRLVARRDGDDQKR